MKCLEDTVYDTYIVKEATDWSKEVINDIPEGIPVSFNSSKTSPLQMGLYSPDLKNYYTSGFVGIGRLKYLNGDCVKIKYPDGNEKECIIKINPRFNVNPWEMMEVVMQDIEFPKYIGKDPDKFYKIYMNDRRIKLRGKDNQDSGDLLIAMSYLSCCQSVCKKRLLTQITFHDENYCGKTRGKILLNKHIKENVLKGREDRVYCRNSNFGIDTLENRILKAALVIAEKKVKSYNKQLVIISGIISYCKNSLRNVTLVKIIKSDFAKVKIAGFNSYYKQAIEMAKLLITKCGLNSENNNDLDAEYYVIPYVIKMEALFEFYVRAIIKEYLKNAGDGFEGVELDTYRQAHVYDEDTLYVIDAEPRYRNNTYLMKTYIPDVVIKKNGRSVAVLDVKYQNFIGNLNSDTVRHNTHQLLFYTLMLNVKKCGFIFPAPNDYYIPNKDEISKIYDYIVKYPNATLVEIKNKCNVCNNLKVYCKKIADYIKNKRDLDSIIKEECSQRKYILEILDSVSEYEYTQWIIGKEGINETINKMISFCIDTDDGMTKIHRENTKDSM